MSKNWFSLLFIILISYTNFSQEKIKGNKNVITVETLIDDFKTIEFGDKLEIELVKSENASVEIEADENLHDVIEFSVKDSVLSFNTIAKIQSSKRLNIIVFYTSLLNNIQLNNDAEITAVDTIKNNIINLEINDFGKAFLNINNQYFTLINNNKSTFGINSKSKLNIESDIVSLVLNENSKTDALIVTDSLQVNMHKSAYAKLEGETDILNISTLNSSDFSAKHLSTNTCNINTEDSSDATIQVLGEILIEASGSSEIYLFGDPKITIKSFKDTSSIHKKEL